MESGERLASTPCASPTVHSAPAPSPAASSPAPSAKSLAPTPPALGSALTSCGHLFRTARDHPFSMSSASSAFPMVSHPAFGLYTASSGRSEFGGLGTLRVTPALAAHPQLGSFPDWWRSMEAHGRGPATFFPPLLSLSPLFGAPVQSRDPSPSEARTPSRGGQGILKGVNGVVNGSSATRGRSTASTPPALGTPETMKTASPSGSKQQLKPGPNPKDKKQRKKPQESSSNSDSESGSPSDSSSEAVSSADSEDLEDDDDDEDEDVQSIDSEDSDSGRESRVKKAKVPTQTVRTDKAEKPRGAVSRKPPNKSVHLDQGFHTDSAVRALFLAQPLPQPPGPAAALSSLLRFQSPRATAEAVRAQRSVIQATGLAASTEPLALVTQLSRQTLSKARAPPAPSPSPPTLSPSSTKTGTQSLLDEPLSHIHDFRLKQEHLKRSFPVLRKEQETVKAKRKAHLPPPHLSPELPAAAHPHTLPPGSHSGIFFLADTLLGRQRANGVIQDAPQDTPLALVAKPRSQAEPPDKASPTALLPVNLSTTGKSPPAAPLAPAGAAPSPRSAPHHKPPKSRSPRAPRPTKALLQMQTHLAPSLVDLFRGVEPDVLGGKDSDDSFGDEDEDEDEDDEDDDDEEEEDSDGSLSESNYESDSDLSGAVDGTRMDGEMAKLAKSPGAPRAPAGPKADCSPLNLRVVKTSDVPASSSVSSSSTSFQSTCRPTGSAKQKQTVDGRQLQGPLDFGWSRDAQIGNLNGRLQEAVSFYSADGKKLQQYPDLVKGIQWSLLEDREVIPRILAMEGRPPNAGRRKQGDESRSRRKKGRPPNVGEGELLNATEAKMLRKLEAQEIARQAAQLKLMRKLEKQALAQAAKEARKQQAIMAAEEKRKQKEKVKILKQQEKIKRIQQIRMEKELRAQQILEAKRRKKEEAANAKILEAEKRTKEKEIRRQQAIIMKHQERERRRQHMMLLKAVEARKKAEERERLKQEKRDEKRLNKERKLELRRLELEMARELKKPNEDMCLVDHKPLPELSRVPGLVLPGGPFSDCLMVLQFLRGFGKVLGLDVSADVPSLGELQEGLLNVGRSTGRLLDLLVRLLSVAVCDPGLPPGHRAKTFLGEHLASVGINRDNVSEILQMYMGAHCGQTELAELAASLRTKAFQAHTPAQKASVLAFLVNELACSKSVVGEIDKNIDHLTNLRRDKLMIESKLRKLRNIHAKKTGKREPAPGGEEAQGLGTPSAGRKRKRKGADSDEEDEEDEDSEDQAEDDEDEDDEGKKLKKAEACEEEDDGAQSASVEELEKQIDKLTKQQNQIRRKLFESSHMLRSMVFGQDRYRRRYWVLPQCGAVFVEGQGSWEGPEELESEEEQPAAPEVIHVKQEEQEDKPREASQELGTVPPERALEDPSNLFLQIPYSFSKLDRLVAVPKVSAVPEHRLHNGIQATVAMTTSLPAQLATPSSPPPASVAGAHPCSPVPGPAPADSPAPRRSEHLSHMITERSGHWFHLLPRMPCDDTSLTIAQTPPPQPILSMPLVSVATPTFPTPQDATTSLGLAAFQVKPNLHLLGPLFSGRSGGMLGPNLPFPGCSALRLLGVGCPSLEDSGSPSLTPNAPTSTPCKSESPPPANDKLPSAPSPVMEVVKPQDLASPQLIPEEMLRGWWKVADMEQLRLLAEALHCRGARERILQKQIQKHMEIISQLYVKNRDAVAIDVTQLEDNQVTEEMLENWCVEEQAMEVDIGVLQQVEELERKVTSASLQLKGWTQPEPQSEREDLVYHEHKPPARPCPPGDSEAGEVREASDGGIARRANNPLDIAIARLSELEKNIERREEEDVAPGLKVWRKAVSEVRSAAQLSLCIQHLQKSIAWERSIMKVFCQVCRRGDNEDLLLLCDGCDKGWHTYCHKPKITAIPEGDWFCPDCISKARSPSPKCKKVQSRSVGGGSGGTKKTPDVKRSRKPSVGGEAAEDSLASTSSTPKKGPKDPKKKKVEEAPPAGQAKPDSPPACENKQTPTPDNDRDLAFCSILLAELEGHHDAWPFLNPVNVKSVPGYRKVIKKPMDFSTIREKLCSSQYQNLETFIIDVNLVFDNCEKFNEDNSEIGRAGHNMRKFFEKRWMELLNIN